MKNLFCFSGSKKFLGFQSARPAKSQMALHKRLCHFKAMLLHCRHLALTTEITSSLYQLIGKEKLEDTWPDEFRAEREGA